MCIKKVQLHQRLERDTNILIFTIRWRAEVGLDCDSRQTT